MTTPMPDPVAFLVEWKSQDQKWVQAQADEVTARDQAVRQRGRVSDLITTDQAEAYAAAKVREALELAADTCAGIAIPTTHDEPDRRAALECAIAIRALIPE